jgi:hypothetical protein
MGSTPLTDILEEARRVVAAGDAAGLRARLLGGLAVAVHAHGGRPGGVERTYGDIDLVIRRKDAQPMQRLMPELGYTPHVRFNALHGGQRMMFFDEPNERRIDVFVGMFEMCHALDLEPNLLEGTQTLTLADLVLTKLQVVEINEKDVADTLVIVRDHEAAPSSDPEVIDVRRLADVCGADWGWFTTVNDNLPRLEQASEALLDPREQQDVGARVELIRGAIASAKKSLRWKARARIGRKMAWYELPEEV